MSIDIEDHPETFKNLLAERAVKGWATLDPQTQAELEETFDQLMREDDQRIIERKKVGR